MINIFLLFCHKKVLGLMRTLTAASKHDSTMYTRMTLENILVVNQYVGLYGENPEKPDEEYFEYIPGTSFHKTNHFILLRITLLIRKTIYSLFYFTINHFYRKYVERR